MAWAWGVRRRSGMKEKQRVGRSSGGVGELKWEEVREREILLLSANDREGPSIFSSLGDLVPCPAMSRLDQRWRKSY
jgi:hypothetical protein